MGSRIAILPDELSGKIAAGEVIERPASIVKELVENALDAGASDILVQLGKGGCESITVVDNGEGIQSSDVPLAFERFATSKISEFDDIYRVRSLGFRGEALPSIAAVSRVEMITRPRESLSGMKIIVEAGKVLSLTEVGCPPGTSVSVTHIFDAVPVRKKFLKARSTEQGYCLDVITKLALSHTNVKIQVRGEHRELLNIPPTHRFHERIQYVLGKDILDQMTYVEGEKEKIKVFGYVSRPEYQRWNTKQMYFYVNKRFVKDQFLHHAVMTAYRHLIEGKRYPSAILCIDVPPEYVDVNVHPAKLEVRFRNPGEIYELVAGSIVASLRGVSPLSRLTDSYPEDFSGKYSQGVRSVRERVHEALKRYVISSGPGKITFDDVRRNTHHASIVPRVRDEENDREALHTDGTAVHGVGQSPRRLIFSNLDYLGQVAGTYLVFSSHDGIVLVDQHAAHERVLFEQLRRKSSGEGGVVSQRLLIPAVIHASASEIAFLIEHADILTELGMEVEPFGSEAVVLKSIPAIASHVDYSALIRDVIELCGNVTLSEEMMREKIYTAIACKAAVKANQILSELEVRELCKELDVVSFTPTCPHGRPVCVVFTLRDMEKMFKR